MDLFLNIIQKLRSNSHISWVEPPTEDLDPLVHHEINLPPNPGLRLYKPRTHGLKTTETVCCPLTITGTGRDFGSNQP